MNFAERLLLLLIIRESKSKRLSLGGDESFRFLSTLLRHRFYVGLLGRDSEVISSYSVGLVQECYVEGTKFAVDINGDGLDDVVCKEERNGVSVV